MEEGNPFKVVKDFEWELCKYTGAKFAATTDSCTNALLLACNWNKVKEVTIPNIGYVSVPMSIIQAGGSVKFEDIPWEGMYQLKPYPIWDSARLLTSGMYKPGTFMCVSFHWKKHLNIGQGGVILHDSEEAQEYFQKARFHGRTEGVAPNKDMIDTMGYHCYMRPSDAAEGLMRLSFLPKHNEPLSNEGSSDLSKLPVFQHGG